jgi:hypothetical protein
VWEERFAADLGRRSVPAIRSLYSHRLQHLSGALLALGTLIGAGGIMADAAPFTALAVRLAALGALAFLVNFVRMARVGLLHGRREAAPGDRR